jgi:hypothetical protein
MHFFAFEGFGWRRLVVFAFCEKKEGISVRSEITFQQWIMDEGIVTRCDELSWMKLNYLRGL